jgi:hypothetical protein
LAILHEADMADESGVENGMDSRRVVDPALGLAPNGNA